ncbi:MAG: protein phosphatase 2C domain-containing protein [Clostridium sp.]|nr:protein phosphatase 2C domain-containing protein [Clostridium sp.]
MPIKLKIGALTDVGLVRANNEDNYLAIPDLTVTATACDSARAFDLGANGALMVVADGMGGMNAGEVASATAIESIKASFSPVRITPQAVKSDASIEQFMNEAIMAADAKIKAAAMRNPEIQGMGTTIVLAWIYGAKLYVSWCGDSRAYVFNSEGLHQITKDHSYVQTLVDQGEITRDQAFDYPQSNVITRSLCDAMDAAEPEALFKPYPLANGDTVILCTDGVSGMLRDKDLEETIGASPDDLDSLMGNIKAAVQKAGASDNFTMCIAQVVDGALSSPDAAYFKATEAMLDGKMPPVAEKPKASNQKGKMPWKLVAIAGVAAIAIALALTLIFSGKDDPKEEAPQEETTEQEAPAQHADPAKPTAAPAKPKINDKPQAAQGSDPSKQDEGSHIISSIVDKTDTQETPAAEEEKPQKPTAAGSILSGAKPNNSKPSSSKTDSKTPAQPSPSPSPDNKPAAAPGKTPVTPTPTLPPSK